MNTPAVRETKLNLGLCLKTPTNRLDDPCSLGVLDSLMYAMMCARQDIGKAVGMSRYQSNPREQH